MTLRQLMAVTAVVTLVFGLALVTDPAQVVSWYGAGLGPAGLFIARLYGALLIVVGVIAWAGRDAGPSEARQAILLGFFLGDAIGFVIALWGQLQAVVNSLGWSIVILYFLFAIGFGYFRFARSFAK